MSDFEIVAHRGVPTDIPENTLPSFQRAIDLGADVIELDVRLTRDRVPIVYHYFYLDEMTSGTGPIFDYTFDQLQEIEILGNDGNPVNGCKIPTLHEVLETIGGQAGLEIEIKKHWIFGGELSREVSIPSCERML